MLSVYLTLIDEPRDKEKFEQLYLAYRQDMYKTAYGILHETHDAEDAVHEAFMILAKNMHNISSVSCPQTKAYLIIIVKNISRRLYNRRKKVVPTDFETWDIEDNSDIEDNAVLNAEREILIKYLMQLSDDDYCILYLNYCMEMSIDEIAGSLSISYEAAKKRLQRARAKLNNLVKGQGNE